MEEWVYMKKGGLRGAAGRGKGNQVKIYRSAVSCDKAWDALNHPRTVNHWLGVASQAAKHGIYVLHGDSIPETMETKHKVVIKASALPQAVNATLINEKEQHCAQP